MHKDCLGQIIEDGAKVLWGAFGSNAGFTNGVYTVFSMSKQKIRIEHATTGRKSTVDPKAVVCVDTILDNLQVSPSGKKLEDEVSGLVTTGVYGNCPVQADGTIDGTPFYFRARGSKWALSVGEDPLSSSAWRHIEDYGEDQFSAGWMTEDEAITFIKKAVDIFRAVKGSGDTKG
jgi:hypothetical protein